MEQQGITPDLSDAEINDLLRMLDAVDGDKSQHVMTILKGWKVVRVDQGLYSSAWVKDTLSCVEYLIGNWVSRPCNAGPLAVFAANRRLDAEMWASKVSETREVLMLPCVYVPSQDRNLWYRNGQWLGDVPWGTRFADHVILL